MHYMDKNNNKSQNGCHFAGGARQTNFKANLSKNLLNEFQCHQPLPHPDLPEMYLLVLSDPSTGWVMTP